MNHALGDEKLLGTVVSVRHWEFEPYSGVDLAALVHDRHSFVGPTHVGCRAAFASISEFLVANLPVLDDGISWIKLKVQQEILYNFNIDVHNERNPALVDRPKPRAVSPLHDSSCEVMPGQPSCCFLHYPLIPALFLSAQGQFLKVLHKKLDIIVVLLLQTLDGSVVHML